MSSPATLSVVLANCNHGKLLRRSLPALFAQVRQPDEWIIIDDASRDDSCAVIAELTRGRAQVTFIRHATNLGTVATFHEGLHRARCDYVYFAASDDVTLPDLFARLMASAEQYPGVGLCLGNYYEFFDDGRPLHRVVASLPTLANYLDGPALRRQLLTGEHFYYPPCSVIIHRETLLATGAYNPQSEWFHDLWFNLQAGLRQGVCFVPESLAAFRVNPYGYSGAGTRYDEGKLRGVLGQLWQLAEGKVDLWITLIAAMPRRVRRLMWRKIWLTPSGWVAGLKNFGRLLLWPKIRPGLWPMSQAAARAGSAEMYAATLRRFGATIAPSARLDRSMRVDRPWRLRVDDGAIIGQNLKITAREAVHIGAHANVGPGCEIDASRHGPGDTSSNPIIIGSRAVIGENSRIYAGAFIADGAIVTPGSTVGAREALEPARRTLEKILREFAEPAPAVSSA